MGEEIRGKSMAETGEAKTPGAARELLIPKVIKLRIERYTPFYRDVILLSISSFHLDAASMIFWTALVFFINSQPSLHTLHSF